MTEKPIKVIKKSNPPPAHKRKSLKNKLRDAKRAAQKAQTLLEPEQAANNQDDTTPIKLQHFKKRVEQLESQVLERKKQKKQKRLSDIKRKQYDRIRFYEMKKINRRIKKLQESRGNQTDTNDDELNNLLKAKKYIEEYPEGKPYIALFAKKGD